MSFLLRLRISESRSARRLSQLTPANLRLAHYSLRYRTGLDLRDGTVRGLSTSLDAQALLHAVRKGRSGAENCRQGSRRISAMLIAAEVQLSLGFTPSLSNPADPPSRGKRTIVKPKPSVPSLSRVAKSLLQYVHGMKRRYRRIIQCGTGLAAWSTPWWSSSCSSSKIGKPSDSLQRDMDAD